MKEPGLVVGFLGAAGHGKTTLLRALAAHFPLPGAGGLAFASSRRSFEGLEWSPSEVPRAWGPWLDAAVLVVAADSGLTGQTRDCVGLLRLLGVEQVAVFLTRTDELTQGAELVDLVEWEVRQLLARYDYPADDVPVFRGSVLRALGAEGQADPECRCLRELVASLEGCGPQGAASPSAPGGPFLMRAGRWPPLTQTSPFRGAILRGSVRVGDTVELISEGTRSSAKVQSIRLPYRDINQCSAGRTVAYVSLSAGVSTPQGAGTRLLAAPGCGLKLIGQFEAMLYQPCSAPAGTPAFKSGRNYSMGLTYSWSEGMVCRVRRRGKNGHSKGGDLTPVVVWLERGGEPLEPGCLFALWHSGQVCAWGIVTATTAA